MKRIILMAMLFAGLAYGQGIPTNAQNVAGARVVFDDSQGSNFVQRTGGATSGDTNYFTDASHLTNVVIYNSAGNKANYDFTNSQFSIDNAWHDWNLSSFITNGARCVHLSYFIQNGTAAKSIYIRKNGYADYKNAVRIQTQVANIGLLGDCWVEVDTSGICEYYVESNTTWTFYFVIRGDTK